MGGLGFGLARLKRGRFHAPRGSLLGARNDEETTRTPGVPGVSFLRLEPHARYRIYHFPHLPILSSFAFIVPARRSSMFPLGCLYF